MNQPLVSIIIPAYNNGATLGVALDSILGQTYQNLEIIVVDDFSTDNTKVVADEYAKRDLRIKVIQGIDDKERFDKKLNRNINAGWSARNAGLAVAKGNYITFQDGDDFSLLNRIEVQKQLLEKYGATHITTNSLAYNPSYTGKMLDTGKYRKEMEYPAEAPAALYLLSKQTKGIVATFFPTLNRRIPFYHKRLPLVHKLFFSSLTSYPGAGNNPFFKQKVLEKVQFRKLADRVWPSFMGRGADRDFNFQVAETFKNSYHFAVPLYVWDDRVNTSSLNPPHFLT
jgi:glycosyltransferase involved in cell wall biosynthesis